MGDVTLHVRLPGYQAAVDVLVSSNATPSEAIRTIASLYHVAHSEGHSLVISPTPSKTGGILDAHTPFHKFKLDSGDILELWKAPFVITLALQTASGRPSDVKRLALDCDTALTNLIPIVQTCFSVGVDEFGFQQCVLGADGSVGSSAAWLNANESLMQQRFGGEHCLLIVPMEILARMPARMLSHKASREGWLYKESHKNNKLTPRKCRYCIVRSAFLFYFKRQNDSHPAGVIPLQYYTVKKTVREPRGAVIVLRRAFQAFENGGADAFLFQLYEKNDSLVDWFECIRNRCVNVSDKLFGVPIERVALATAGDDNVPHFVRVCCEYLAQPAVVGTEGLFRLSGSAAAVAALKDKFDQAQDVSLADSDPHTVTALLKAFFRELPAPLFPYDFYELMIASHLPSKSKEKQLFEMFHTTSQLPRVNYDVLRFLCRFLHGVAQHAERNKMSHDNLSRVWASNLLRRRDESLEQDVVDIDQLNGVVADLILYHDRLNHIDDKSIRGYRNRAPTVADIVSIAPNNSAATDDDEDTLDERRAWQPSPAPNNVAAFATVRNSNNTASALQRTLSSPRSLAGDLALSLPSPPTTSAFIADAPPVNENEPIKTGFLTKQGGQRKNWKSRWFVLSSSELAYFVDNKPRSNLKGVISLKGVTVRVATELRRSHTIAVVTSDRIFYLSADSEPVCTAWLNTLTQVVNRLKAPPAAAAAPAAAAPQQQPPQQQQPVQQEPRAMSPRPISLNAAAPSSPPPQRPISLNAAAPGRPPQQQPAARAAPLPQVPLRAKSPPPPAARGTPVQQHAAPLLQQQQQPPVRGLGDSSEPAFDGESPRGGAAQPNPFRPPSLKRVTSNPKAVGAVAAAAPAVNEEAAATIRELTQRVAALEKELMIERALRADAERRLAEQADPSVTPSARLIDDELQRLTREQAEIDAALAIDQQYRFGAPTPTASGKKKGFDTTI